MRSYWELARRRALSRRGLLHGAALGVAGLAGSSLFACAPQRSTAGPSGVSVGRSGGQTGDETPQAGGTVTWYDQNNPPTLDPQATSSVTTMQSVSFSLSMMDTSQIETPDKTTVVFKLKYPYAPFVKFMASGVYSWILPREALAGTYDAAKTVIGSGPFTLESFAPDVAYVYKKNPDWWEQGRPYVDGVRRAIIPQAAQRLAQFTGGQLHLMTSVPATDLDTAKQQNPKAEVFMLWDAGGPMAYFQLGDATSPFQDVRLRRAVSMAIDRAAFGKIHLNNQYQPSFNAPLSLGKWSLKLEDLSPDTQKWFKLEPGRGQEADGRGRR